MQQREYADCLSTPSASQQVTAEQCSRFPLWTVEVRCCTVARHEKPATRSLIWIMLLT